MTIVRFEEINTMGWKNGKCSICGKRVERAKKFYQTLNPFNLNQNGLPKTREEITKELLVQKKK